MAHHEVCYYARSPRATISKDFAARYHAPLPRYGYPECEDSWLKGVDLFCNESTLMIPENPDCITYYNPLQTDIVEGWEPCSL